MVYSDNFLSYFVPQMGGATLTSIAEATKWVTFDATGTVTILDHSGVTSVTDNASGDWTVNWSSNFANDDYAVLTFSGEFMGLRRVPSNPAVGSVRIVDRGAADRDYISVITFGDT